MKTRIISGVAVLILSFLSGCQQRVDVALKFQPEGETFYRAVTEAGKDYAFVQPSLNKNTENHTLARVEVAFAQKTESVDKNGVAVLNITVMELKYFFSGPKGKTIDFDSSRQKDKSEPLAGVIGQSYKIKITPSGQVEVVDALAIRSAVKGGSAGKLVQRLFGDDEIQKRHSVLALIDAGKGLHSKGEGWSTLAASPPGMLQAKSYEKQYTLQDVKTSGDQQIAVITMNAVPSSKRAPDMASDSKGMGFFAKMFEDTDTYKGELLLNLSTGQIVKYEECLKAEWVAAESPEEQKSDKGPDTLTMGFTHLYSIEKIGDK